MRQHNDTMLYREQVWNRTVRLFVFNLHIHLFIDVANQPCAIRLCFDYLVFINFARNISFMLMRIDALIVKEERERKYTTSVCKSV